MTNDKIKLKMVERFQDKQDVYINEAFFAFLKAVSLENWKGACFLLEVIQNLEDWDMSYTVNEIMPQLHLDE